MRISGGKAKGIPLSITKTNKLRPASEANRERLFSSLGEWVLGKSVLDLFAGSGSYGLEALSRGALSVHFVERNHKIYTDLEYNFEKVCKSAGLEKSVGKLEKREVLEFLKTKINPFDLVFLDPPYSEFTRIGSQVFNFLYRNQFVHSNSLLVHEAPNGEISSFENWRQIKTLGKGKKGAPIFRLFKPAF